MRDFVSTSQKSTWVFQKKNVSLCCKGGGRNMGFVRGGGLLII